MSLYWTILKPNEIQNSIILPHVNQHFFKWKLVLSVFILCLCIHTGDTSEGAGVKRLSKLSGYCFYFFQRLCSIRIPTREL